MDVIMAAAAIVIIIVLCILAVPWMSYLAEKYFDFVDRVTGRRD